MPQIIKNEFVLILTPEFGVKVRLTDLIIAFKSFKKLKATRI